MVDLTQDVEKITMAKATYDANKKIVDNFISKYPMIDVIIY
jgi:F0F1-type ATP synthase membrane subunit b/b'